LRNGPVLEILTLDVKAGQRDEFQRLYVNEALPLLRKWKFRVLAHGPSPHDADSYYVIRLFDSLGEREASENAYYGSDDWNNGPRRAILDMVDHFAWAVVPAATWLAIATQLPGTADAEGRSLVQRLFGEAVNEGRVELIKEIYAPHFIDRTPGPGQAPGPAGIVDVVERYRAAIPDLRIELDDVVVADGFITTRETWTGTHRHDLADIPATNRPFSMSRMHIFRVENGAIVEEWTAGSVLDTLRTVAAGRS